MSIHNADIEELRDSYELHQCSWAKRCLDNIEKKMEELQAKANKYDALAEKMKDEIENNEWSTKEYDCDTADYKQSQAIGAWNVLIKIKQELIPEEE